MAKKHTTSGAVELNTLLSRLNQEGHFSISVLADAQGLPIASAEQEGLDPDRQSAVVALIQKTAVQASRQLGMQKTDEITLYDAGGQRLICRPIQVNGFDLILAVMAPDRTQSYRRITNSAITRIAHIWSEYWG
ncbi:MAG: roadblock/LC7 domain-containing protein [Chloroflexi bacterium]|jgi:predicted regulator of Ras-like GTPase activity (Roadblock/LC7/MglB family)|nr:roadblock/LC7 domain-containing protein [Anaerolineaceae bacterium]NMB88359.1 roadblock/LC7 domain-containing protein [Chloroflexota bacterium]